MMAKDVTLGEEELAIVKQALDAADRLCTAVISGKPGQMALALDVARSLSDIKRKKALG
jgi:hypothetical protein